MPTPRIYRTSAIVLSRFDLGEADRVLTLLTPEEGKLKAVAKGHETALDGAELTRLVDTYYAHARYEENVFLPLSKTILGRNANHMAALGLSLHLRHTLPEVLTRFASRI